MEAISNSVPCVWTVVTLVGAPKFVFARSVCWMLPTDNELVRTNTLVKGAVVLIDAHPFKTWYEGHYGVKVGVKKKASAEEGADDLAVKDPSTVSKQVAAKFKRDKPTLEIVLDHQSASGRPSSCQNHLPTWTNMTLVLA